MSFANSWETQVAANVDTGHLATGHLSVTGTATVNTPLAGVVKSCVASIQAPVAGAAFVGVAPTATPGQVTITVQTSAFAASTTAVTVDWWASDAE